MNFVDHRLVESHLMSYVEIMSEEQRDGIVRWAWTFSPTAVKEHEKAECEASEWEFRFESHESAARYALGWLRRNRPAWVRAAEKEALEGVYYRARQRKVSGP